jgi:hypothetical protein
MVDTRDLRRFCQIGFADKGFGKSALNARRCQARDARHPVRQNKQQRLALYKDLLNVTQKSIGYAINAEKVLGKRSPPSILVFELLSRIKHYGDLARQVYDQTCRRVIYGERVAVEQKVVSIFEDHTDVITTCPDNLVDLRGRDKTRQDKAEEDAVVANLRRG